MSKRSSQAFYRSLRQSLLGSTVYSDAATGASGPSSVPAVGVTSTRLQTLAQSGVVPLHPYAYSGPPAPVAVAPTTAVQTRVVEVWRSVGRAVCVELHLLLIDCSRVAAASNAEHWIVRS